MTMNLRFNDEKARAAILLWAEVNGLDKLYVHNDFVEDAEGENIQMQFNKMVAEKAPYIVDVEDIRQMRPIAALIKDTKTRKFVRDWSETFGVTKVYVAGIGDGKEYIELYAQDNGVTDGRIRISIPTQDGVWIGKEYSVDELCGEDE